MNAFLKVGKSVSFPLDLPYILPSIERTIETIANAESELTLPTDQIRFAQFWWMNATPLDGIAFNHLINGNMYNPQNHLAADNKTTCFIFPLKQKTKRLKKRSKQHTKSVIQMLFKSH